MSERLALGPKDLLLVADIRNDFRPQGALSAAAEAIG